MFQKFDTYVVESSLELDLQVEPKLGIQSVWIQSYKCLIS
jgi:hypothetical protein